MNGQRSNYSFHFPAARLGAVHDLRANGRVVTRRKDPCKTVHFSHGCPELERAVCLGQQQRVIWPIMKPIPIGLEPERCPRRCPQRRCPPFQTRVSVSWSRQASDCSCAPIQILTQLLRKVAHVDGRDPTQVVVVVVQRLERVVGLPDPSRSWLEPLFPTRATE